jgi:uncharacterized protein (TIGR02246 family)
MRYLAIAAVAVPLLAACTSKSSGSADSTTPPASVAAPGAAANTKADEDSIRAIGQRWNQMLASKDTVGMGALFAADGAEYPPNQPAAKGPAAVTSSFGGLYRAMKDVKLSFAPTDIAVAQGGDLAVERGTYQISWTDAKGKAMNDHGNYVTAWKKVNGQWKVLADINASEVPMPGM